MIMVMDIMVVIVIITMAMMRFHMCVIPVGGRPSDEASQGVEQRDATAHSCLRSRARRLIDSIG